MQGGNCPWKQRFHALTSGCTSYLVVWAHFQIISSIDHKYIFQIPFQYLHYSSGKMLYFTMEFGKRMLFGSILCRVANQLPLATSTASNSFFKRPKGTNIPKRLSIAAVGQQKYNYISTCTRIIKLDFTTWFHLQCTWLSKFCHSYCVQQHEYTKTLIYRLARTTLHPSIA